MAAASTITLTNCTGTVAAAAESLLARIEKDKEAGVRVQGHQPERSKFKVTIP